jgi:CHAT domain-containing protein
MSTPILIPLIGNQLGHSLCYEEHKGNYKQASELAASSLEAARDSGDTTQLTDALLAVGIVNLVQGKPGAAANCFAEAEQLAHDDVARQLYAVNGSALAAYYANNLFPGWGGANGGEEMDTGNETLLAEITRKSQRRSELLPVVADPSSQLTDRLMSDLLTGILPMRSTLELSYLAQATDVAQLFEIGLRVPISFRKYAESLGADPGLLAYTMLVAADFAWRGRRYDVAPAFLQEAFQGYTLAADTVGTATCLMTNGDWMAAPFSSPLKWNFALQTSASEGSNLSWTIEAVEFTQQGANLEQALATYQSAEALFRQANAPRGLASIQLRYGYLAMLRDDYLAAAAHARAARQAFDECGDWMGYYLAQTHLILSRVGAGEVAEQRELAQEVGRWGATEGSFSYALGLGLLLSRAARHWLLRRGDYQRALTGYSLAEALFAALGATSMQGQSLVDQAETYDAVGERNAARTVYEQALDLYEEAIGARPRIASMLRMRLCSLAVSTFNLGVRMMDADEIERCAVRLRRQLDQLPAAPANLPGMMQALSSGLFKALSGNVDPAAQERMTDSGLWGLSRLAQSNIAQARVLVPLYRAQRARDVGDEESALPLFADALEAARATASEERDMLEATVLAHQKQYTPARAAFDRYMGRGGATAGFIGQLTNVLAMAGSTGKAEVQRQQERNYSLAFSFMIRIKAYDEAHGYLQKLLQVGGEDWWSHDERPWLGLSDCAEMYEGLGRLPEALAYYDRAIAALEERRKLLSRDELKTAMASDKGAQYLYFLAARAALKLSEAEQQAGDRGKAKTHASRAFDYVERGRARALLDLMAGSATLAGASDTESQTMREWRRMIAQLTLWRGLLAKERGRMGVTQPDQQRVAALEQQIEAGEAELRRIEAELDPLLYQALSTQAPVISAEQVSALLPPSVALLEYGFLGDDLLAWAFNSGRIVQTYRASVDAKMLTRQIRALHHACKGFTAWEPLAAELSNTLLAPLSETIRASQWLIIVAYGAAHSLPFHILPWDGQPLIRSHAVSYLPSASALQFLEQRQTDLPQRMLAVGNPSSMAYRPPDGGTPTPLNPLQAAEKEARIVASLFHEGRLLVGAEATKPTVVELLNEYPLLHLATHGYLSEEAPLLSALMLADGASLSVYELMGLRLNADLVVLSACNTAQGKTTGGDDVLGLTRGLLAAGARAAVVSLWPVDDISTSLLMVKFYRELRHGSPPTIALQAAQQYLRQLDSSKIQVEIDQLNADLARSDAERDAIRPVIVPRDLLHADVLSSSADYSHPFFWAPFILVG